MAEKNKDVVLLEDDPQWYKDAILYELHVRAFADSDGDGVGDFRGLSEKLDYLRDLGVTAIWLLPFYPSPLKDDGYDIADYTNIHPAYGTLADFRLFLREAHRRGLRVVTELVLNHTSDQHAWFQRARRAPAGNPWRDFYVWSETPEKYKETRIIFKDFETSNWTWDAVANAYFWHRFYSHQPDLNYDNPEVCRAMFQALDFWFGMGVDGLRLDAVPYLFEREGTNCENLSETHEVLKALRRQVDEKFRNRMLLAEANQWPEDAAAYFGAGNEVHMAFHFPLMPRMFMAVRMEDRYPVVDILGQTPSIPESCQWAVFLRNHDELTLEMVTDEERDYMYRVFARDPQARINLGIRRRLAPLLGNSRRQVELMNGLLFALPGTPVIYYGDEIGMGDNIYLGDRNGVRTPMQWSPDRNAGFSRANAQRLYLPVIIDPDFHYESVNVEAQQNNPNSLLWWMRRLIALRKRYRAFGRGTLEFLFPENHKVLAFLRRYQDETVLVVANLSRFAQYVELNLSEFKGMMPVELFGQTEFPPIGELPYLLTLSPYAFHWFSLVPQRVEEIDVEVGAPEAMVPTLRVSNGWKGLFEKESKAAVENILPAFLRRRRWFGGKARVIKSTEVIDFILVPTGEREAGIVLVQVEYREGDPETYVMPLTFATGERASQVQELTPHSILARLITRNGDGLIYAALREPAFCEALLEGMARRRRFRGYTGEITTSITRSFRRIRGGLDTPLAGALMRAEQSNSSVLYGDQLILKIFRRLEEGINPDLEIGLFLTEKAEFPHIPPVAGALEYRWGSRAPMTLGILHGFVPSQGDAWRYTLDQLGGYFERALARPAEEQQLTPPRAHVMELAEGEIAPLAHDLIGGYLESARLLGQRTAELHLALTSDPTDPNFAPESFSSLYQRSLYQSMRNEMGRAFQLLRQKSRAIPPAAAEDAKSVLALEGEVHKRLRAILDRKITALRTRLHGDYHLGQVLYTGKDFVIIDFEGEPARPISERRIKRSPLRDVTGMIRSFHYAAYAGLFNQVASGVIRADEISRLDPWARLWYLWVSSAFLKAYLRVAAEAPFLPRQREELVVLLDTFLLNKAVYELGYELNHRPEWLRIPLQGLLHLLETSK